MKISIEQAKLVLGCYTENRAYKNIIKARYNYPKVAFEFCSTVYPPMVSATDSVVFIPGEPVFLTDTMFLKDTITRVITKQVVRKEIKVDTVLRIKNVQLVDRAKETYLSNVNLDLSIALAKQEKTNDILFWVTVVLGIYTLARWVFRFWGIKIP